MKRRNDGGGRDWDANWDDIPDEELVEVPEELIVADIPGRKCFVVTLAGVDPMVDKMVERTVIMALRIKAEVILETMIREALDDLRETFEGWKNEGEGEDVPEDGPPWGPTTEWN